MAKTHHLKHWGDVILTAFFLIKRTPSSFLKGLTPYELVYKKVPSFDNLRVFVCLCFSTKLNNCDKFSSRTEKCIFLGYCLDKKGYKPLSLDSHSFFVSRDVKFYESVFPFKMQNTGFSDTHEKTCYVDPFSYDEPMLTELSNDNLNLDNKIIDHQVDGSGAIQDHNRTDTLQTDTTFDLGESFVPETDESDSSSPNMAEESSQDNSSHHDSLISHIHSKRETRFPSRFNDYIVKGKYKYGIEKYVNYSNLSNETKCFVPNLNKTVEPQSYLEASKNPKWIKAMNLEMEALYRN